MSTSKDSPLWFVRGWYLVWTTSTDNCDSHPSMLLSSGQWYFPLVRKDLRVPPVVQWVKNPIAEAQVTAEVWVWSQAPCSASKDQHCHIHGIGCSYGSDLIPGPPEKFHMTWVGPLKKQKKKVLSGYTPKSGIARTYGSSMYSFLKYLHILFSVVVVKTYIPTNSAGGFPFLHTPSSICYLWTC